MNQYVSAGARLSGDRVYRYCLWRQWDAALPSVMFIGLNPSTADECSDDHTIRRCVSFATSWGFGRVFMLNLFAFRATKPDDMKKASDPVGPKTDAELLKYARKVNQVVAAWGVDGGFQNRGLEVGKLMLSNSIPLWCLGETVEGFPKHPARLAAKTKRQIFS